MSAARTQRWGASALLLRVGNESQDAVRVVDNQKVETPVSVHPSLPDVARLVVLLRPQRRVPKIPGQETARAIRLSPLRAMLCCWSIRKR